MSCYFRHLQEIFDSSGIEVTKDNRKKIDEAIHKLLKVKYKDCPRTWKEIKKKILMGEKKKKDFADELKKMLG
jgi:predicted Fe-Mo cluster-binding NifX family protein